MAKRLTDLFPVWAILLSTIAYCVPAPFASAAPFIAPLLGLVMLGMGLTLTAESFKLVLKRPRVVIAGTVMQFAFMPAVAWVVAQALELPRELATGLVLVGACPGGTASNVITYLAAGDVALSITLTSISTVLAAVATPALTWLYLDRAIDVPALSLLVSVLEIVLLPVACGAWINMKLGSRLDAVRPWLPLASIFAIVAIIAIIIGSTADQLASTGPLLVIAVALHNGGGLLGGYMGGRLLRFSTAECRTLAIEVGMQNSGLGVALAVKHFSAVAALPGAVFSIWHNLSGSALAVWWSRRTATKLHS